VLTALHEWILTSGKSRQAPAKDITLATMNYLKLAFYQLVKHPGLTTVAGLILALTGAPRVCGQSHVPAYPPCYFGKRAGVSES
jgi:hypothetical protein